MDRFQGERLPIGWPWRFLMVSFVIFLTSILIYLGLAFGYKPFLNRAIAEKDAQIMEQAASVKKEDQDKLIQVYSQMINIKSLLSGHIFPSGIFAMLEQKTHPKVYFTGADFKADEGSLELDGLTVSFSALSEQLEIFSKTAEIEKYTLRQAQQSGDLVQFQLALKLGKGVILPQ